MWNNKLIVSFMAFFKVGVCVSCFIPQGGDSLLDTNAIGFGLAGSLLLSVHICLVRGLDSVKLQTNIHKAHQQWINRRLFPIYVLYVYLWHYLSDGFFLYLADQMVNIT